MQDRGERGLFQVIESISATDASVSGDRLGFHRSKKRTRTRKGEFYLILDFG